jgi:hypothetical protein
MKLYHATPIVRALAIMLRGFHNGRDGEPPTFRRGIYFEVEPKRTDGRSGIVLNVEDAVPLRRFAVSFWPMSRAGSRAYFYLLPADVANCYELRMVGDVAPSKRFTNE